MIKLSCGMHTFELSYPHPIDFNNLSIKISRSNKTVTIMANRQVHNFEDEEALLFVVNPDRKLTLPHLQHIKDMALKGLTGMQFAKDEDVQLSTPLSCPPLTGLKNWISIMMNENKLTYFTFMDECDTLCAFVMVINRVYDYELKAPAIDLLYLITSNNASLQRWNRFRSNDLAHETRRSTIQLMEKTFLYFSKRTICSRQIDALSDLKKRVDSCFKRAVVYPLYGDPDDTFSSHHTIKSQSNQLFGQSVKVSEEFSCTFCRKQSADLVKCDHCLTVKFCGKCKIQYLNNHAFACKENEKERKVDKPLQGTDSQLNTGKCSYCSTPSQRLMNCSQCHSVQYCNRDCQRKHWKEHKSYCQHIIPNMKSCSEEKRSQKASTIDYDISSQDKQCAYCFQTSQTLRQCSRCHVVQYCNEACQQKHWKEHKELCKESTTISLNTSSCSYCSKVSYNLKKCALCRTVQYCDRECQRKHWKDHKVHCKPEESQTTSTPVGGCTEGVQRCSFCSRIAKDLRKCTRCHRAQYCGRNCQQKHWDNHKKQCKSAVPK